MRADNRQLNQLAKKLWEHGIAAFCPTTISTQAEELNAALERLGSWILETRSNKNYSGALPLGIHLEGPFINPESAGAHPSDSMQPLTLEKLQKFWEASRKTLKIITLAPELLLSENDPTLGKATLSRIGSWAQQKGIQLSLGHSQATQTQARLAFECGISGVTHAWNALSFHHRSPGALGAALGRKNVYIELIADGTHVSPALIRWTCQLHSAGRVQQPICFVSDCAPAAGTFKSASNEERWYSFGPLQTIHSGKSGACRLPNGSLAGGGLLLAEAFSLWLENETRSGQGYSDQYAQKFLKQSLSYVTRFPLKALNLSPSVLRNRQLRWELSQKSRGRFRLTWRHNSG